MLIKVLQRAALPRWDIAAREAPCALSQGELARRIGAPSRKTVMRLLRMPALTAWIRRGQTIDRETGRRVPVLMVAMFPPPVPGHEGVPLVAMAERLLQQGALLPGDEPQGATVSAHGTAPGEEVGNEPIPLVSPPRTAPGEDVGKTTIPLSGEKPPGHRSVVIDDEVRGLSLFPRLLELGISGATAAQLLTGYSAERIERNVRLYHVTPGVKNPPAWLRRAIERDYAAQAAWPERSPAGPRDAMPALAAAQVEAERRRRAERTFAALEATEQRALRERAEQALTAEFGHVTEGMVLARIYRYLTEEDAPEPPGEIGRSELPTPAPPLSPREPAPAARFYRWYVRKHAAAGLDLSPRFRVPAAVRARRVAWAAMRALGASLREIGAIASVDKVAVQYGLRQIGYSEVDQREAERWRREFIEEREIWL